MATDLQHARPAPSPKKYEAFVETQLARARARIRALDLAAAGLGLLILTLAYGLLLALCDRRMELSPLVRQIAFSVYAAGAFAYLAVFGLRPLFRPINPYYAARRLEETIPEAKNSVVNWLDLRQQPIAPAFRSAISHQAATDLRAADLEQAISARRASWLGSAATALFVGLLILFVLGPRQFLSLMNRAFAPFIEAPIATRTRLEIVRPEGGDATIAIGQAISFSVWVEGRIPEASSPEALKLLYRYNLGDPYQTRPLERGDSSREWFTNFAATEVHNGFWYRMAGGDAQTPEHHVQVRSTPLFTGFDVAYHYRPYLYWPDRLTHDQNLQDLRGTEITLLAHTNRSVSAGQLVIEGEKPIAGELVPEDPQALRFRLRLEKDGSYRIWFRSTEAERNIDPMAYTIRVLLDHPPQVELTKPGEDSHLPTNGILRLEGSASDDFGLVSLSLQMKVDNGPALQAKPYRKGEALHRGDGSYPQVLAYRDFVELNKLQKGDGQPLAPLAPGSKLEYWLEGKDNCDYPGPNTGESKHFTVTIQPPVTDKKKQDQEHREVGNAQQQHEQKQDQDLQNQKRQPPDGPQEPKPSPQNADAQGQKSESQTDQDLNRKKKEIEEAIKKNEQKQNAGGKGDKTDSSQPSKGENKDEGNATGQAEKGQNQEKENGKANPQAGQDKSGGKSQASSENKDQKGQGQAASRGEGDRNNTRGQQGTEHSADQPKADGNNPEQEQKNGANQTGRNTGAGPTKQDGPPQDKTASQPGSGVNDSKTNPAEKPAGAKANGDEKQNSDQSQQSGAHQNEQKNGSGKKAPQSNAGQGSGDKKSDTQKQIPSGEQQKGSSTEAGRKQPSETEKTNQPSAGKQPETGTPKSGTVNPREDAAKQGQRAEQSKGGRKQGSGAEKSEEKQQHQQTGQQQAGEKQGNTVAGPQPDKAQEKGAAEQRADKTGGSQGDSKAENSGTLQSEGTTKDGQGGGELKPAPKNGSRSDTIQKAPKSDKIPPGEEKARTAKQSATETEKMQNSQNPAGETPGADKGEKKSKSSAASGPNDSARPQQPQSDSQGAKAGEEAKDTVSDLSKALKNQDEKTRAAARKRLEELRDSAKDPATRQAAADALERTSRDSSGRSGQKPADARPGESNGPAAQQTPSRSGAQAPDRQAGQPSDQSAAGSTSNEPGHRQADGSKSERKNGDRSDAKTDSRPERGKPGDQANASGQPAGSGSSQRSGANEGNGETPKKNDSREAPDQARDHVEPPSPANAAYRKQAGDLQLQDIKKRINKDVLKSLNMTEEDFQKFVKAYDAMLKRKQPAMVEKENLTGPQRGNRAQPNQNVRLVDPREQGKAGNLQRLGPVLPPPEFREAYKEFSKRISDMDQPKEKK